MRRILVIGLLAAALSACGNDETPSPATLASASPVPLGKARASPTPSPTATTAPSPTTPTATPMPPTPTATLTPLPVTATPASVTLRQIGQLGGPSKAVAVEGRHAYINVGPRLVILDVADPADPTMVGQSAPLPGFEELAVSQARAYVAAGEGGVRVIDVSDPAAPIEIEGYFTPGPAWDITVVGLIAYVAAGDGVHILDISNPGAATAIGFFATHDAALDVTVVGNVAYVAEGYSGDDGPADRGGLRIVDVSDPANPDEIGFFPMNPSQADEFQRPTAPRGVQAVAVAEDRAYLTYRTERRGGLKIIDVSDPANPIEIGDYQDYVYFISEVTVVENHAYVATGVNFGLLVLDVSDPTQTVVVPDAVPGSAQDVTVAGTTLYVADEGGGLHIGDISDPARAVEIGHYNTLGDPRDVIVAGDTAYVTDGLRDLWLVDISDPARPTQLGLYTAPQSIQEVAVWADPSPGSEQTYAFIAAETAGLLVLDVSDPGHPTQISAFDTPGLAYGVAVSADPPMGGGAALVYVAAGSLQVLSMADPNAPTPVAVYESQIPIRDVVIVDKFAFFTHDGLHILDISNPAQPEPIGDFPTSSATGNVAVAGDFAYLMVEGGVQLVELSDPARPLPFNKLYLDVPPYVARVALAAEEAARTEQFYVYEAGEGRLRIVDVSDPASPIEVGSYDALAMANAVGVRGSHVFVADGIGGLVILSK